MATRHAATLYKTSEPTEYVSEYYEEAVIPHPNDERDAYQFLEFHGWWDESQKRPMHNIITISPDEGCSLKEAEDLYVILAFWFGPPTAVKFGPLGQHWLGFVDGATEA
jgi:hypothetical protein